MKLNYGLVVEVAFEVQADYPSIERVPIDVLVKAMRDRADSIEASQDKEAFNVVDHCTIKEANHG